MVPLTMVPMEMQNLKEEMYHQEISKIILEVEIKIKKSKYFLYCYMDIIKINHKKIINTKNDKILPLIFMVLWSGKRVESVREKKSDLSSLSMTIYKAKLEMNNFLNFLGRNGRNESKWKSRNGRNGRND